MANGNGTGKGGKSFQDRQLAAEVRTLGLLEIKKALTSLPDDDEFKKAVVLKLAGTVLPRLTELSGPEGEPIPILNALQRNNGNTEGSKPLEED